MNRKPTILATPELIFDLFLLNYIVFFIPKLKKKELIKQHDHAGTQATPRGEKKI